MARSRKKIKPEDQKSLEPRIKVRLDNRTIITLKDMSAFDYWKERYPAAEVIAA